MPDWDRAGLLVSPIHAPVAEWVAQLPDHMPDCDALNALVAGRRDVSSGGGAPIRFAATEPDAGYELAVHRSGVVPTRPGSLHDLFNALAWAAFPATKAVLNRAHVAALACGPAAGSRGVLRDAATLFDEGGAVVACADPTLARLLRAHDWRALFVARRNDLARSFRCLVFGHAVMEKAVRPYRGITARALVIDCDLAAIAASPEVFRAYCDRRAAAFFALDPEADRAALERLGAQWKAAFTPLPILGIPGWDPANADPAYYDDTAHFRPKRRGVAG